MEENLKKIYHGTFSMVKELRLGPGPSELVLTFVFVNMYNL